MKIKRKIPVDMQTKFSEWITQKFLQWQNTEGKRKTLEEFAAYIGTSRPLLNMWMNGTKPRPGIENIKNFAEIFGDEIYDVLEMPRPNPYKKNIDRVWDFLPEDFQKRLSEEVAEYETKNISERISKTSKPRKAHKPK